MKTSELQKMMSTAAAPNFTALEEDSRVRLVRKIFREMPPCRVLDVGCADGFLLSPLAGRHTILGVDICPELVAAARGRGMDARVADVEDGLPSCNGNHWDAVFLGEAIEHTVDTDRLLCEINRVLRPGAGARLVMTFPNIRTIPGLLMMLMDLPPMCSARYRSGHVRDFTLPVMRKALKNNGFAVDGVWGTWLFHTGRTGPLLSWLGRFLPSWSGAIVLTATKVRDVVYDPKDALVDSGFHWGMWR
jgi:SAM-dependent methyltransferase